jgi:hypothetical protein
LAETRQIGRLTIYFLGDNAAQLAESLDGSLAVSQSFRDTMNETARTQRHIFVGSSLDDLRDQPGFDRANFNPNSERARDTSAYGRPSGADSYFVVVTNKEHHLVQNEGQTFPGSIDLSLVHELLHPSQIMRTLAEIGKTEAPDSEARVQMREQKIAEELGKTPGKDFPDVFESGPYGVRLNSAETQPRSAPQGNPAPPVNPKKSEDLTPLSPAQPTSLPQIDSIPVRRLVRLNSSTSPAMPVVSSDGRNSWGDRFGSAPSFSDDTIPRNPNVPMPPPEAEGPLGLVSGKPMRLIPLPIFNIRDNSNVASGQNWFTGLSWDGRKPQASAIDAGTPARPLVSDRQNSFGNGSGAASPSSDPGDALAPPMSAPPDSQGPLSLNDAYLEYLKRLNASQLLPASAADSSAPAAPLVPSDDANFSGGLLGRLMAVAGVDPLNPGQLAPPQDDELRAFYRDDPAQPWTLQRRR